MSVLKEYNGYFCELEYEYVFLGFLEREGWLYTRSNKISRSNDFSKTARSQSKIKEVIGNRKAISKDV